MTYAPHLSRKVSALLVALVWTVLTIGTAISPSPAYAGSNTAFYRAELAAPAAEPRLVAAGVIWQCVGTTCIAPKAGSRPLIVCARLARTAGDVTSFVANGTELAEDKLTRCND